MSKRQIHSLISIISIFVIWEIIALFVANRAVFPHISDIFVSTMSLLKDPYFYRSFFVTSLTGLSAFLLSFFWRWHMENDDVRAEIQEIKEQLIQIRTMLEILNKQFSENQPRLAYLERETERQKDSLKQAHHRIDEVNTRTYWLIGACITLLGIFVSAFVR